MSPATRDQVIYMGWLAAYVLIVYAGVLGLLWLFGVTVGAP